MPKEMLINVSEGEECRIALLEDGRLEELYMERTSSTSHVGNIYKGKVTNVEASIQAAFIDFGLGRNGFLHISDLMPTYFGRGGSDVQESVGKSKAEIQRDLTYLSRLWQQIEKKRTSTSGPTELYTEGDLVARTVRDVFASDIDRLIVDNRDVAKRV